MNTLTDILGLNNRNRYTKVAKDNDMIIVGTVQAPTIEGIAGPIPPHDIKLIRVIDLLKSDECVHQNVPTSDTLYAGVFRDRFPNIDGFVGESILNGSAKIFLVGTKSFEVEVVGFNIKLFKIAR